MIIKSKQIHQLMLCAVCAAAATFSAPVVADGAGAFLGGIAVARIGESVRDQRDYEEDQAYYQQQQAYSAQRQADAAQQKSPQQRLADLKSAYDNGYITQQEYETKKAQILDDM